MGQLCLGRLEYMSPSSYNREAGMAQSTKVVSTRIGPQSSENEGVSLQVFPGSPEERRVPYLILTGNNRETHEISTQ